MSTRKTYYQKVADLNRKAKQEVYQMMLDHGVRSVDLRGSCVSVFTQPGKGANYFREYPVTCVEIIESLSGDILTWHYNGANSWVCNPTLWMDICGAVGSKFGKRL